jgi:hypothetical protein
MFFAKAGIACALLAVSMTATWADGNKPPSTGELYSYDKSSGVSDIGYENGATATAADQNGTKMLKVELPKDVDYPGIHFPAPSGGWDLSDYKGTQIDVTNNGPDPVDVNMRVDNEGDWKTNPWSADIISVAPGETKTLKIVFGEAFKKAAFKLDPAHVSAVHIFTSKLKNRGTILLGKPTAYKE